MLVFCARPCLCAVVSLVVFGVQVGVGFCRSFVYFVVVSFFLNLVCFGLGFVGPLGLCGGFVCLNFCVRLGWFVLVLWSCGVVWLP